MTQEEKQLLFSDICARLPYGVICQIDDGAAGFNDGKLVEINISEELARFDVDYCWKAYIDDVKPYLHPMSSMTEEEKDTYDTMVMCNTSWVVDDWLNSHHFDYRGLIEQGLAIEAPKEMYN